MFNDHVAPVVVEGHNPVVEETGLPEQCKWQGARVIQEEVDFCLPRHVVEWWQSHADPL